MNLSAPDPIRRTLLCTLGILLTASGTAFSSPRGSIPDGIVFLSPVPEAKYVLPETTILVTFEHPIDGKADLETSLTVTGSVSGRHDGTFYFPELATLVFKPVRPFAWNETVTVDIDMAALQAGTTNGGPRSFSFKTSRRESAPVAPFANEMSSAAPLPLESGAAPGSPATAGSADSLPATFPQMTIVDKGGTSTGFLFLSNFNTPLTVTPFLMILRNDGSPVFYRKMKNLCFDFKVQPNGRLTYYDVGAAAYYAMDSSYAIVDSFRAGNGYATDGHDLLILANGHALLMASDPQIVDMSSIAAGGDTAATVIGMIIQELDDQKNVVFQWRSWDHYQITDATHEVLYSSTIDYVHGNALELDSDGNILVSCRHMDEVTKIDRRTGEILWRWGGKHNQFKFLNDTIGFSHQHAIRRIAEDDFILFDNGNFRPSHYSRAVEYKLDQQNRTAELVWQYRNTPTTYGSAMGYAQRLPNGNTLIGWGATNPSVSEVRPDGSKIYELSLPLRVFSYRAYRFDWESTELTDIPTLYSTGEPGQFSLDQNYPNPFNPVTRIYYTVGGNRSVPSSAWTGRDSRSRQEAGPEGEGLGARGVSLIVYDMLGREVGVLVNERKTPGNYEVCFDGRGLASGMYIYRLRAGTFVESRTMLLLK